MKASSRLRAKCVLVLKIGVVITFTVQLLNITLASEWVLRSRDSGEVKHKVKSVIKCLTHQKKGPG